LKSAILNSLKGYERSHCYLHLRFYYSYSNANCFAIRVTEIQSTVLSRLKYITKARLRDMLLRFLMIE